MKILELLRGVLLCSKMLKNLDLKSFCTHKIMVTESFTIWCHHWIYTLKESDKTCKHLVYNIKIAQESFNKLKQNNGLFPDLKSFCIHQVMVTKNSIIWSNIDFTNKKSCFAIITHVIIECKILELIRKVYCRNPFESQN